MERWTLEPGRGVAFDGQVLFTIDGTEDRRGLLYIPAELDELTRVIVGLLNMDEVDGSGIARYPAPSRAASIADWKD